VPEEAQRPHASAALSLSTCMLVRAPLYYYGEDGEDGINSLELHVPAAP